MMGTHAGFNSARTYCTVIHLLDSYLPVENVQRRNGSVAQVEMTSGGVGGDPRFEIALFHLADEDGVTWEEEAQEEAGGSHHRDQRSQEDGPGEATAVDMPTFHLALPLAGRQDGVEILLVFLFFSQLG